jgi:hypothetical protein
MIITSPRTISIDKILLFITCSKLLIRWRRTRYFLRTTVSAAQKFNCSYPKHIA